MRQHHQRLGILLCCCLVTGCGPTLPNSKKLTHLSTQAIAPAPVQPAPVEQSTISPRAAAPASTGTPTNDSSLTVEGWISLDRFCRQNGFNCVRVNARSDALTFECSRGNERFRLTAGSKQLWWNGTEVWLGFPPQRRNNQILIHAVDGERTIQPLLSLQETLRRRIKTVVIDPGHGGENSGTRSISSRRFEKEYTLDWAKRLRAQLVRQGYQVYLTRTNDIHLTLPERVVFADKVRADLFLSLHFNSHPGKEMSGLETYCLTPKGLPSTLTRGFEDNALATFPNNGFDPQNLHYALSIHRALVDSTGAEDHGVRRARFMGVLRGQARPAVLIEGGYLSNPEEARLISTTEYRQKLADAVAIALATPYPVETAKSSVSPAGASGTVNKGTLTKPASP